ncbi:head GIN domain-containing protein [Flectobacillus roseus]
MRKLLMASIAILLVSVSAWAQNSQEMTVQAFTKVDFQGIMKVEIVKGSANKVTAEAHGNLSLDDLTISVSGGELSVKTKILKQLTEKDKKANAGSYYEVKVVYSADLSSIKGGRGAELQFGNVLAGNHLILEGSSGAIIKADLDLNTLEVASLQGAIVNLEGKAKYQSVRVNTGGQLHAFDLKAEQTDAKVNTGGMAEVAASQSLDASAGTGGMLTYKGNPSQKSIKSNLGGEVKSL